MDYRLVFYMGNEIAELELPRGGEATAGSGEGDTLRIARSGVEPSHLRLSSAETGVRVSSAVPLLIGGESSFNRVLSAGETAVIEDGLYMFVYEKRRDFAGVVSLPCRAGECVTLGRSRGSDIRLNAPQVS